ncbi:MAG: EAL domain-containing protein [Tahibacter sp.]
MSVAQVRTTSTTFRAGPWLAATLIACAAILGSPAQAAQRDYYFRGLGSDEGLAQNTVLAIEQDRAGFVWVATQGGLHRYDGYTFRLYEHSAHRPDSLPENFVTAVAEDSDGQMWVGLNTSGLVRLDPATGASSAAPSPRVPIPASSRANSICALWFDPGRGLWVGSREGIALLDPVSGERRSVFHFDPTDLPLRPLHHFIPAQGDIIYAATSQGLLRINRRTLQTDRLAAPELSNVLSALLAADGTLYAGTPAGLFAVSANGGMAKRVWPLGAAAATNVSALAQDRTGRLWLAVRGAGLVILDPHSGSAKSLRHQRDVPGSVPEEFVTNLMLDRSGLLWVGGVARGIATTRPDSPALSYILDLERARDRVDSNNVSALWSDNPQEFWVGTEGDGLKRYDRGNDRFDSYSEVLARAAGLKTVPTELRVYAIATADAGKLWIGGNLGLSLLDPKTRTASLVDLGLPTTGIAGEQQEVRSLLHVRDGSLWIGTRGSGLLHYSTDQKVIKRFRHDDMDPASLPHNMVLGLLEDAQGRIWVGTLNGLALIDAGGEHLRNLQRSTDNHASLNSNIVRHIHQGADGTIWIATHSGLSRLDSLTDSEARFSHVGTADGLAGSTIYGILEDRAGTLWLSTNRGITRYDPSTRQVRNFSMEEGLQAYEFNGGAAFAQNDGELLYGGIDGINLVRPSALQPDTYVAPVVITAVGFGAVRYPVPVVDSTKLWTTEQSSRLVNFEFAALDFTTPSRNHFSYRLLGFDDNWVDAGTHHEVTYTNLDAGDYTFELRGSNADGVWNMQGASLRLRVLPPWWATQRMKALYLLLGTLIGALIWRQRRAHRREELRHQNELIKREDRLRLALWGSGDEFWDWDMRNGRLYRIGADQLLGSRAEESISADDWRNFAVHSQDLSRVEKSLADHVTGITDHFESEHRIVKADGEWVWVLSRGKIVERDADGQALRICGTARDITASRLAERERRIAAEVIRNMTEAVTVTDLDYHFISVNLAFTRMTGYREDEILGRNAALLNSPQHPPEVYEQMRETLDETGHWRGELWQKRKDGDEFLCWLELAEVRDAQGSRTHFVGVLSDITDRKRAEQELRYLANYDTLTGLPNRTLLGERLGHAIIRARRNGRKVAVLFLDLDRFKHVNDSMGHAAGDRMLKAAGMRLRSNVRETDTVARLGGDEFTVVLEDVHDVNEAEQVALKLLSAFAEPLELDAGQEVVISPSIGVSLYPEHAQVPTDLLKFADTAMYQAKEHGRNTYKVYTSDMDAAARKRATMVSALRKALERRELRLVFQPKLSLAEARITGVEALLRWHSEELGEISPVTFIPLAEESGLIIEIGEFVLNSACATLARWRDSGIRDLVMAVNVSVLQLLRGELTRRLCEILAEHDISPDQIELELTESTIMANAEQSVRTLNELKSVGVSVAIDDFGTGYSSLSYLKRLPIDTLKIDKEFVGDITSDPDDEAITATIITMAHSLGLNVIAEGVETPEQLEYLREQGCDEIQGNWLSHPLSADRCLEFLRSRRAPVPAVQR